MYERKRPKISIIIPCWFTESQSGKYGELETYWFASKCIRRLLEKTERKDFELILIDNGSTMTQEDIDNFRIEYNFKPEEVNNIENISMDLKNFWNTADIIIRNNINLGFAPACNQGFALARGEYIVCMNDDILVWKDWEKRLIEVLDNENLPEPPGISMPALMKQTKNALEAIEMTEKDVDLSQNYNEIGSGAEFGSLWMIKKELLDKIYDKDGYIFDENFKLGMGEDRDLWDRVRALGYQTYRTHKTRVYHQGNMTMSKVKDRKDYTSANREYLSKKREERNNIENI